MGDLGRSLGLWCQEMLGKAHWIHGPLQVYSFGARCVIRQLEEANANRLAAPAPIQLSAGRRDKY